MEITGKPTKVDLYKKDSYMGNDSYNVALEGDDRKFSHLCKGEPKIKVGVPGTFVLENKEAGGKTFWTIKLKTEPFVGKGGGFKPRSNASYALEWARKLYNSSHSFNNGKSIEPWDITRMTNTATWMIGKLKSGFDKDSLECAVTIECAAAMNGNPIMPKRLSENLDIFEAWIKANKE